MTSQPGYREAPPTAGPSVEAPSAMEALKFPFQGRDWVNNLLLGAVFLIIPIVGPIALRGWMTETHQRLLRQHPQPLPKLTFADLAHFLERGVAPFVVELLVMFPMIFGVYAMLGAGVFVLVMLAEGGAGAAVLAPLGILLALFTIAGLFFGSMALHAATTRVEISEDLGASMSPRGVWDFLSRTWKTMFWPTVGFSFGALGLALGGMAMCFLGLYPAIVAIQLASMHLRFQSYRVFLAEGGVPYPMKPARLPPSEAAAMNQRLAAFGPAGFAQGSPYPQQGYQQQAHPGWAQQQQQGWPQQQRQQQAHPGWPQQQAHSGWPQQQGYPAQPPMAGPQAPAAGPPAHGVDPSKLGG